MQVVIVMMVMGWVDLVAKEMTLVRFGKKTADFSWVAVL